MGSLGIADRHERFLGALGVSHEAVWLAEPVKDAELRTAERELGYELPTDWVELLRVHNGGRLLDTEQWIACTEDHDGGVVRAKQILDGTVLELAAADPPPDLVIPGPRTLWVSAASHVGILYDLDEEPGRLLYMDVMSRPGVIPLARSLASLLDTYIALAEAGFVLVDDGYGPYVQGPPDEVRRIFVEHKVADAASSGISSWLMWPGAADFSID